MSNGTPDVERYVDAAAAASALAEQIAAALTTAISDRGRASLVVSGGKSPIPLFVELRARPLDWNKVSITLADERWVAVTDSSSNEKLVRDHLLQDAAAGAQFTGLKNTATTPEAGGAEAWDGIAVLPRPFDVVVLGMGDDGHTASVFPSSPNLHHALDINEPPGCIAMLSPAAPRERLSLNLTALLDSRKIFLLLGGSAKWQVYLAANGNGPAEEMPIRALLRQQRTPLQVIWSP